MSGRGALHVAQALGMWVIPGYILYKVNVSETVKGDLSKELPTRPVRCPRFPLRFGCHSY